MKSINLSEKFRIEKDTYSWVLIFTETRKREKLDKKRKKTGVMEDYAFKDKWYYPDLKTCLHKYIDLDLKPLKSIEELSLKLDAISLKIDELKNTIFKP
jgi:hypothetical protein